jgi:hypothetical protein
MNGEVSLKSTQNEILGMVKVDDIRPICDLMLELIKQGPAALPMFLNRPGLETIVEKGLKTPKKLYSILKKEIENRVPCIPELPPLKII